MPSKRSGQDCRDPSRHICTTGNAIVNQVGIQNLRAVKNQLLGQCGAKTWVAAQPAARRTLPRQQTLRGCRMPEASFSVLGNTTPPGRRADEVSNVASVRSSRVMSDGNSRASGRNILCSGHGGRSILPTRTRKPHSRAEASPRMPAASGLAFHLTATGRK